MNNFYVYTYTDPLDQRVIYVGKGLGTRDVSHWKKAMKKKETHNHRFSIYLFKCRNKGLVPKVERVQDNLDIIEALLLEASLIYKYGRLGFESGGSLLNFSRGFEGEKYPLEIREEIYQKLRKLSHHNQKLYKEEMVAEAIELYKSNDTLTQWALIKILSNKYEMNVSPARLRLWLIEAGVKIRTKSEMRIGVLNPAFGRRGVVTSGFKGKIHSEDSKRKTSETLHKNFLLKLDRGVLEEVKQLRESGLTYEKIGTKLKMSATKARHLALLNMEDGRKT